MTPASFLSRTFSYLGEPSSKRIIAGIAAVALCLVFVSIGTACTVWIYRFGELGAGAVSALTFMGGCVVTLAGVVYRKPDSSTSSTVVAP